MPYFSRTVLDYLSSLWIESVAWIQRVETLYSLRIMQSRVKIQLSGFVQSDDGDRENATVGLTFSNSLVFCSKKLDNIQIHIDNMSGTIEFEEFSFTVRKFTTKINFRVKDSASERSLYEELKGWYREHFGLDVMLQLSGFVLKENQEQERATAELDTLTSKCLVVRSKTLHVVSFQIDHVTAMIEFKESSFTIRTRGLLGKPGVTVVFTIEDTVEDKASYAKLKRWYLGLRVKFQLAGFVQMENGQTERASAELDTTTMGKALFVRSPTLHSVLFYADYLKALRSIEFGELSFTVKQNSFSGDIVKNFVFVIEDTPIERSLYAKLKSWYLGLQGKLKLSGFFHNENGHLISATAEIRQFGPISPDIYIKSKSQGTLLFTDNQMIDRTTIHFEEMSFTVKQRGLFGNPDITVTFFIDDTPNDRAFYMEFQNCYQIVWRAPTIPYNTNMCLTGSRTPSSCSSVTFPNCSNFKTPVFPTASPTPSKNN